MADSLGTAGVTFSSLRPPTSMRVSNIAQWINGFSQVVRNEMYSAGHRYDVVVFVKAMDQRCVQEAERIRAYGGKVIFDANVNYYETWGEYEVPGTKPTKEQQQQAMAMTELADWVVADSTYLLKIVRKLNANASWIPDNVNMNLFPRARRHEVSGATRLVWSGVAKKAAHILTIVEALKDLSKIELFIVSECVPDSFEVLSKVLPCRFVPYDERHYAKMLSGCDIIISPKSLSNAYEVAHTEYKITLGMAAGLPVIASPQESYETAIEWRGGGIVARNCAEWKSAIRRLSKDIELRRQLGELARITVIEKYSTPVVAAQYWALLLGMRYGESLGQLLSSSVEQDAW